LHSDKTHFTLTAAEYEVARSGHLERRRYELVEQALASISNQTRQALEIGFGSGKLLADCAARFPAIRFLGTEVEPKMVSYAQEKYRLPNVTYAELDITTASLSNYQFAYSIDVIHHIHDPLPFFQAIRSALDPGGIWLAIEPNIFHPVILYQQESMRRRGADEDHFRPWKLEPLIRQAGFKIEERRFAFLFPGWIQQLPPGLMKVERIGERLRFLGGSVVYVLRG
jgi:SAM-dependent methyltransferase